MRLRTELGLWLLLPASALDLGAFRWVGLIGYRKVNRFDEVVRLEILQYQ